MSGLLRATFHQVLRGRCCRVGASEMKLIILHTFAHQAFNPARAMNACRAKRESATLTCQ